MAAKLQKPSRKIPINRYPFTPATYPGRRPRFSFFFTSKGIYRLKFRALRSLLKKHGLPSLDERYAILAYGSNACPDQLLNKNLTDVPVLYGRLKGAEVVYAGRKTQKGYVPATLARKKGTRSSWVTLLTREQLTANHFNIACMAESIWLSSSSSNSLLACKAVLFEDGAYIPQDSASRDDSQKL
jgi:hypothetical protein